MHSARSGASLARRGGRTSRNTDGLEGCVREDDVALARVGSRWWPVRIDAVPRAALAPHDKLEVYYFGDHKTGLQPLKNLRPFTDFAELPRSAVPQAAVYSAALAEARAWEAAASLARAQSEVCARAKTSATSASEPHADAYPTAGDAPPADCASWRINREVVSKRAFRLCSGPLPIPTHTRG